MRIRSGYVAGFNLTVMKFSEIIGHKDTIESLRELADSDRIPHAILMGGPSGIGKMRLARAFVDYIYCQDRQGGDSCGKCPACLQNAHHNNPDVHFIYPRTGASQKSQDSFVEQWNDFIDSNSYMSPEGWALAIEAGNTQPVIYRNDAAEILRTASLSSFAYKYKTYVVWLPERMHPACANALLKLLEEPFPDTLFILVSNEPGNLLPTIFSRTQRFNLKPLTESDIAGQLMGKGMDEQEAKTVASLSEGSMLRAIDIAGQGGEMKEFSGYYMQMMRMAYARQAAGLRMLGDAIAAFGREKNARYLNYCARMTRENFIYNLRMPPLSNLTRDEENFSHRFSPYVNHRNVEAMIHEIEKAQADILRNANAKLVMFDFSLRLMHLLRK